MHIIESYIKYLRNISRKIITRSGFENILPTERTNQKNFYFDLLYFKDHLCKENFFVITEEEEKLYNYLSKVDILLNNLSDKKLFIGLGLFNGACNINGKKRLINAPLLYAIVDVEYDENKYFLNIDISSYQLNYDLFAKLFHFKIDEEFEEYNLNEDDIAKLRIMEKIEKDFLDTRINNFDINENSIIDYLEIFDLLSSQLNEFKDIVRVSKNFDYKNRLIKTNDLTHNSLNFYDHIFLFVNNVPNELSTYEALDKLSKEKNIKNKLLEKVFENTLTGKKVLFEKKEEPSEEKIIDVLNKYIPLQLSKKQKESIVKAWQNEISYIEGPPGTGKSHTITAILISAIFLNKKVLLVSQKKPAIDIVKSKVDSFLGKGSLLYIGEHDKSETKERIERIVNNSSSRKGYFLYKYPSVTDVIDGFYSDLENFYSKLSDLKKQLVEDLSKENDYYNYSQRFLKSKENFIKTYTEFDLYNYRFCNSYFNINSYLKALNKYKNVYKPSNYLQLIYKNKFLRHFSAKFECDIEILKSNFNFIEDIFELNKYNSLLTITKNAINKKRILELRKSIEIIKENKLTYLKTNISNFYLNKIFSNITDGYFINIRETLKIFKGMLHFKNPSIVKGKMDKVNFHELTEVFPLWCSELRNLGNSFPLEHEIFDLVIVDEASQVNIAEIIPAFYRGKQFCIVGDEKQLHLNATGVGFAVSKSFDKLTWNSEMYKLKNNRLPIIEFEQAKLKNLIVTESSILKFINSDINDFYVPKTELDEHFRSLPQLAKFNNKEFYSNNWKIMTENGENIKKNCFKALKVGGSRASDGKYIENEIIAVTNLINSLTSNEGYNKLEELKCFRFNDKPTIGILSILTQQKYKILDALQNNFSEELLTNYNILVATPEEFQGNERDIMIITLGLDSTSNWSKQHYENKNRFNVATSRAKYFTYLIYSGLPDNSNLLKKYFSHFGLNILDTPNLNQENDFKSGTWNFNLEKIESEFEVRVAEVLQNFIIKNPQIELYNQVNACGQKRLDFVLYNKEKKITCAVEVDGKEHFEQTGVTYTEAHLERDSILKRAGWKIINIKYYNWYADGWLCKDDNPIFQDEIKKIYSQLNKILEIN